MIITTSNIERSTLKGHIEPKKKTVSFYFSVVINVKIIFHVQSWALAVSTFSGEIRHKHIISPCFKQSFIYSFKT